MQVQDVADFFGKPCQELPNFMSHSLIEQGKCENYTGSSISIKINRSKHISTIVLPLDSYTHKALI